MQNKNTNEMHWKDKLEEAGSFPYAPAGKELAWQKLNGRLQGKKKRKKTVWYWGAAACLLPLFLFGLFTFFIHQRDVVIKTGLHTSTAVKPSTTTKPEPEEAIVTAPAQVKKVKIKETAQKSIAGKAGNEEKDTPVDSGTTNRIAVIDETKDSIATIASAIQPQKKKLRVVHINELNEPFEPSSIVAHNVYYPRFLPLQIARESVFPEPLKTVHSTEFISLKNKSSN